MSWQNQILRVNLTTGVCAAEHLPKDLRDLYLGQRGLGIKYLYDEVDPRVDPLAPDNKLIFATGPLTGTPASTGGRYSVITKGALTNAAAVSNSGGYFGPAFKNAGYDVIIIEGKAETPVYLLIEDDDVKLLSAEDLWGQSVWDTEHELRRRHGAPGMSVASIGRAGELMVKYACIINDLSRAAGRSGVGAVMGSKNLKAIAASGTKGVRVADPEAFAAAATGCRQKLDASPNRTNLMTGGTLNMMNNTHGFGSLPTRNGREVQFDGYDKINAKAVTKTRDSDGQPNLKTNKACFACSIGCGRVATIDPNHFSMQGKDAERYKIASGGLEYENSFALGAMCGVDDVDAVTFANFVCDEHGMDTISFGGTMAAAMELSEEGAITDRETGMPIPFGSAEALVAMVTATAHGEGFGKDLALGAKRLCEKYGRPELAMVVKGQEIAGYDPRGMQGMGVGYATSNRGACHTKASPFLDDFVNVTTEGKAENAAKTQNIIAAWDSAGLCGFTRGVWHAAGLSAQLNPCTGQDWDEQRLLETGERVFNLERMFNNKAGFTAADDTLPPRFLKEGAPSGTAKGAVCELGKMMPEYYRARGWNQAGEPDADTLARLKLA